MLTPLPDSLQAERHLAIDTPGGGTRVIAEIYPHSNGVVFLDVGWCLPHASGNAAHLVEGTLAGVGPWTIGGATIRRLVPGEPHYRTSLEWRSINQQLIDDGKDYATRDAGERFARSEFG